eukprot:TRINITY_DN3008_c0_g1_i4.p2 TRINITY_DN3008_c0_g1~~TRINITY_DN3008_c0_g1_i4.p2  ORF type:complete len:158 (-),score=41.73 TRINITY_DN3008_c0_g1_i4:56-529(-)
MAIKTETCAFSGLKIYPGHGARYVRIDSKLFIVLNGKSLSAFKFKRNPRKIQWTLFYRRLHKKTGVEEAQKSKSRRSTKFQRAIVGATLDVINKKRNESDSVRQAAREAALREVKERKRQAQTEKKKEKDAAAQKTKAAAPKAKSAAPKATKAGKGR